MNNFTIIRQKLSLIFIIITFIIANLVFLNCAYNSLFVWSDNDNDVNLTDGIIPVSSMFGYKILANSYVVNGNCTKYNNDIILTTNINTISFSIFRMIFTLYVMMIILTYFSQLIAKEVIDINPFEKTFYSNFKDIIRLSIFSVLVMSIISNNFNNPGDNKYKEYDDIEETFESYLFVQYRKINDQEKNKLINIFKNTNKNNFNDDDDYIRIEDSISESESESESESYDTCIKMLELCKNLCNINRDTNVDVVKIFNKFLQNCQISDIKKRYNIEEVNVNEITDENKKKAQSINKKLENSYELKQTEIIKKTKEDINLNYDGKDYIIDNNNYYYQIKIFKKPDPHWIEKIFNDYILKSIEYVFTDIKCVFSELNFLKTNFDSIFTLLEKWFSAINPFGKEEKRNYNTDVDEKKGMNIVLLTSLLTKDLLKKCGDENLSNNQIYGDYLRKMGEYAINGVDNNKTFIKLMDEKKASTFRDLFIIKGLVTGIIVFAFANIVLKKYYKQYHYEFLKSIDKNIVLYYIYGDHLNAYKYETIRTLLNADDYSLNAAISLVIIILLLKPWGYPVNINLKCPNPIAN